MKTTKQVNITAPSRSHMLAAMRGFAQTGWVPVEAPQAGRLASNRQLIVLQVANYEARFRLFIYKVTGSSRGKPDERRIQITSTYQKGLPYLSDYQDAVLGFDADHNIFVGVDPRRLDYGGPTGNASTFFDREGLDWDRDDEILVAPRAVRLFPDGIEYHAFFKPPCLAEYLLNMKSIHDGTYSGSSFQSGILTKQSSGSSSLRIPLAQTGGDKLTLKGPSSKSTRVDVSEDLIEAYEQRETTAFRKSKVSPKRLRDIRRRCEENGYIGEEFVLNYERQRLRRAGKDNLSEKVRWVSQESVAEGYDILSFEENGDERWIEVKSSVGEGSTFEMSQNEWQTAIEAGGKYHIYRVIKVKTKPKIRILSDPYELEKQGVISISPSGWRVEL